LIEYISTHNNNVARAFLKNLIHYIKTNQFPKEVKLLIAELDIPKVTGRKKVRLPQVLSEEQVFQLANAMSNERNKLMCLITFFGGLRVSELIKIKPYDFSWEAWLRSPEELGKLKVIGKGNKQRLVLLPSKLMGRIYKWIKEAVSKNQSKDNVLFKIGVKRWEEIVDKTSQRSLGRRINPHLLRHSCSTWLSENGFSLQEISEYLGHASISTTQLYVHLSQEKIQDKYKEMVK
jgi:site-specific recombinase XerD